MACESLTTLQAFKTGFLTRFEGTDEGELPGPVHLAASERVLQFLLGSYEEGLTYSYPGLERRNRLLGWVDSDYVSDPDTRTSVTGY
eukprot:3280844-Rhodomonas_salina.1